MPVGIPTPAVAENISRGVLDGAMNDWTLIKAFRILDVTHYHFEFPLGGVIAVFGMNQKDYNSLPPKAKAAIDKYSGDYFSKLWGDVVKEETKRVVARGQGQSQGQDRLSGRSRVASAGRRRWSPVVEGWAGEIAGEQAACSKPTRRNCGRARQVEAAAGVSRRAKPVDGRDRGATGRGHQSLVAHGCNGR